VPRPRRRALQSWSYVEVGQTGSHIILQTEEPGHQRIPIPSHKSLGLDSKPILRLVSNHKGVRGSRSRDNKVDYAAQFPLQLEIRYPSNRWHFGLRWNRSARSGLKLNDARSAAITHGEGPLLVIAGAGNGKNAGYHRTYPHLLGDGRFSVWGKYPGLTFTDKGRRRDESASRPRPRESAPKR